MVVSEKAHLIDEVRLGEHSDGPLPVGVRLARHLDDVDRGDVGVARHHLREGRHLIQEREREIFIDNLLVRVHLLVDRPCATGL